MATDGHFDFALQPTETRISVRRVACGTRWGVEMSRNPTAGRKTQVSGELVARSYTEVAAELERRHGWKLSKVRVQQLCWRAEQKIKRALAGVMA